MAFSPTRRVYGAAALTVGTATGTRAITATHSGGTTYPNAHIDGSAVTINVVSTNTGTLAGSYAIGVAIVEDSTDAGGDYTDAAGTALSAGVLAYKTAIANATGGGNHSATVTLGDNSDALNPPITKGGTYRIVLTVGTTGASLAGELEAKRRSAVDTDVTSQEYHADSDALANEAKGGASLNINPTGMDIGGCGHRVVVSALTPTAGNWKYRQSNQIVLGIRPAGSPSAAIINPKELKLALTDDNGSGAISGVGQGKLFRVTPNTTGDVTQSAILVDTDFGEVVGGSTFFRQVAINDEFGDTTTPANETAGIWSTGTIVGVTTAQRSPYVFSTTGHASGLTFVDTDRVRSTTADLTASASIRPFKDAAFTTAGVGTFSSSAYTTVQDIFKRTGPTVVTNATVFLEAYIADAYGAALASLTNAFSAQIIRPTDSVQVNAQTLSTDAAGRIRWNNTPTNTAPAFNRFLKSGATRQTGSHASTGPDNPASPPATFSSQPAYARTVRVDGTGFSGGKEPRKDTTLVFGLNSEGIEGDLFTSNLANAVADSATGEPTTSAITQTAFTLGSGSCRWKGSSLISPATLKIAVPGTNALRDVAGRNIVVTTDFWFQRRGTWNATTGAVESAAGDSSYDIKTALAYANGNGSDRGFESQAAPADPATLMLCMGFADISATRATFGLTATPANNGASAWLLGGAPTGGAGFTSDVGNFGYTVKTIRFGAIDTSLRILGTQQHLTMQPGEAGAISVNIFRFNEDQSSSLIDPDLNEVRFYDWRQNASGGDTLINGPAGTLMTREGVGQFRNNYTMPDDKSHALIFEAYVSSSRIPAPERVTLTPPRFFFDPTDGLFR